MNINGICISSTSDEHGPIYVYQTRSSRILSFNGKIQQSCMKLKDINGLAHGYTRAMMSGLLFVPEVKNATIMGLGAGSMAKSLLHSFPELEIDAIEYREAVVNIAKKYFYLPDTDRLTIHIDDAIGYMKHNREQSDIIFSDLFNTDGMEPKQVHSAYLRNCKNALNEQGVLVLNLWRQPHQSPDELEELLARISGQPDQFRSGKRQYHRARVQERHSHNEKKRTARHGQVVTGKNEHPGRTLCPFTLE
jgi:spermidine synthase